MLRRWIDMSRLRFRALFNRGRADTDLDRELQAHLDREVDELVGRGMSREEAYRTAVSTFGGVERVREESRDARGVAVMENLGRDLRYALRGLRREPMLLVAATVSIAVGAAGNLAVFSLAREFMLESPDVRRPEELVQFRVSHGSHASYQRWLDLNASDALGSIAGYSAEKEVNWRNGDAVKSVMPLLVTANFFDVSGVPVTRGRPFTAAEARAEDHPRVVVVSHSFWQNELAGDSAVVGRVLTLNDDSYVILGVLAPRLRSVVGFAISPGIYAPLNRSLEPGLTDPDEKVVKLMGRLKAGQSIEQARAAVDAADRRLGRLQGDTVYAGAQEFVSMSSVLAANGPKATKLVGGFFVMLGLVSFMVLLIACANEAGLLIARATRRRQEIAIRLAIGGTRRRLVQQFLMEGFWLALIGTVGGFGLSVVFMRIANSLSLPIPIPFELNLAADPAMFAAAVVVIFISIVLCAVLPALGATRLALVPALKREEPFYATRRFTARGALLTGQVTVSTVLLVTAFLFLRNLQRTQVTDPGFEVNRAIVAQVSFVRGRPGAEQASYLQRAVDRVTALPGVEEVAFTASLPLTVSGAASSGRFARIDTRDPQHVQYSRNVVGPGFFSTLNIRMRDGREFSTSDKPGTPLVAIVNEEFVRRYYNGANAVGSRIRFEDENLVYDIVGVVQNGKHETLGEAQRAALFFPLLQFPEQFGVVSVVARTTGEPSTVAEPMREALTRLDPSVAVTAETMRSALRFSLLPSRIGAAILGTLGLLGLVLAAFGLYALVSYNVSRRVGEIAIRTALGATRGGILRLVVRDAALLVGGGVVFGLAIAALITAPLATFLVTGLSSRDPVSFVGTALAFGLVCVLASWLPARSATRVSPVVAMRLD